MSEIHLERVQMRKETENLVINYKNQQLPDLNISSSIIPDSPNEFSQISQEIKQKLIGFASMIWKKGPRLSI